MKMAMQTSPELTHVAKLIEDIPIAMLTTMQSGKAMAGRPMAALEMDAHGALWFLTDLRSAKVERLRVMAGNVLVVKHVGCVPQCAIAFEKLLLDAGAPVGAYIDLLISCEQSDRVTDDADLDQVIPWAVWGRMYNAGQTCCAAKRFIVPDAVADKFLARFKAALEALKLGDQMDEKTTLGPLSTEAALVQLLAQFDAAVESRAKLLPGGKRVDRPGWFMQPTIPTDIAPGNPASRDEFFARVVPFFRVKSEDEAIALANDSDFGLAGSVWTKDEARGLRLASRVDTGMRFVDDIDWSDAELPFGGIKHSGYGRELGRMGIQEFVNRKLVRSGRMGAPV